MGDLVERLGNATVRFASESIDEAKARRNQAIKDAASEIERLQRELAESKELRAILEGHLSAAIDDYNEARRQAFEEAAGKAREYAAHYPEASDGRNTFIIFAEWAEAKAGRSEG